MNNYHIVGPSGTALNNSVKNRAHSFIDGTVYKNYFDNAWKKKKRDYSVWNENGKLRGFAITRKKKGKILEISLIGTNKGKGIGSLLMKRIIALAKKRKYRKIVLDSVTSAYLFYTKFGFKLNRGNNDRLEMSLNLSKNTTH